MFNKTELNEKLTAELREIAKTKGILNAEELRKAELVEIIAQIAELESATEAPGEEPEPKAPKVKLAKAAKESTAEKPARKRIRIPKEEEKESNSQRPFNRASLFDPQPASSDSYPETIVEEEMPSRFEPAEEITEVAKTDPAESAPGVNPAPAAVPAFDNKKNKPQQNNEVRQKGNTIGQTSKPMKVYWKSCLMVTVF